MQEVVVDGTGDKAATKGLLKQKNQKGLSGIPRYQDTRNENIFACQLLLVVLKVSNPH